MNKEIMKNMGFGASIDAVEAGLCPHCLHAPDGFKDEKSEHEHRISGLCQICQDEIFCDPALAASIKKWEKILDGTGVDQGARNCPLCLEDNQNCGECIIGSNRDNVACAGTPYAKWAGHHIEIHNTPILADHIVICDVCRKLAQAEIDYLKGLR